MIYRRDIRYSIAKLFTDSALRINFSKLVFTGKENIPSDVPLILAPNHRNALIDALLMVYASPHKKQIVFLARSDIFKQKAIAWILRGMRIIPVYRIRDGKENLDKNGEIFDIAAKVLQKSSPIGIFPEATHNPKQSLLSIKKAVPRIVLPAEAQHNFLLNSHIVPVSIYYTDIYGLLSECYVHFGKPISVSKYKESYNNNPNQSINQLRREIETELKEIVVDIWNDEYYDEYTSLIQWNSKQISNQRVASQRGSKYIAAQHIVGAMDKLYSNDRESFDSRIKEIREAKEILKSHRLIDDWQVEDVKSSIELFIKSALLVLSLPIALFGFVNNIFPIIIEKKIQSLFKDKQFISSARYVAGLFFVPIFDVVQSLILYFATSSLAIAIGYFVVMPTSFIFALYWRKWRKSVKRQWRINRFSKKHYSIWSKLISLTKL